MIVDANKTRFPVTQAVTHSTAPRLRPEFASAVNAALYPAPSGLVPRNARHRAPVTGTPGSAGLEAERARFAGDCYSGESEAGRDSERRPLGRRERRDAGRPEPGPVLRGERGAEGGADAANFSRR